MKVNNKISGLKLMKFKQRKKFKLSIDLGGSSLKRKLRLKKLLSSLNNVMWIYLSKQEPCSVKQLAGFLFPNSQHSLAACRSLRNEYIYRTTPVPTGSGSLWKWTRKTVSQMIWKSVVKLPPRNIKPYTH